MRPRPGAKQAKWRLKPGVTWQDKLRRPHPNHGKVVQMPRRRRDGGVQRLLIPRPLDIEALVRRVPKGRVTTVAQIRAALATAAGADDACPLTTGIFLRIVAEAAEERRRAGFKRLTPWWRVVSEDGALRDRFPGGAAAQARLLRREGCALTAARGKRPPHVRDLAAALVRLHRQTAGDAAGP